MVWASDAERGFISAGMRIARPLPLTRIGIAVPSCRRASTMSATGILLIGTAW
jgi:hypothetical protein